MRERPVLTVVTAAPDETRPAEASTSTSQSPPQSTALPEVSALRRAPTSRAGRVVDVVARVAVVVAVAGVAAVSLAPRLVKGDLPTDAALVGTTARGVVKADRDYALVDVDTTDGLRAMAALRSPPVWDFDDERARKDAQLVQKVLVRVGVGLEALRKQHPDSAPSPEPPSSTATKAALDELRAVVAGELASSSLEAPEDPAWRALVALAWANPAAVDVVANVIGNERTALVTARGATDRRDADVGVDVVVRAVGAAGDERVVARAEVVDVDAARVRAERNLRAALSDAGVSAAPPLLAWLRAFVVPTLSQNVGESEVRKRAAAAAVPPVIVRARRGETVLRPGEVITARHQLLVRAMAVQQADDLRLRATAGTGFFVALVVVVVYLFGARRVFQRRLGVRDVLFLGVMLTLSIGFLVGADAASPWLVQRFPGVQSAMVAFAIPIAFGPMCVRLTLPPDVALLFALVVALLGGVVVEPGMSWAVVATLSSMTGAASVMRGPRRFTVVLAGLLAGVVGAFAGLTLELFRGALSGSDLVWLVLATLLGGALAGVLTFFLVPVVESAFGYVTDQRLYRLADLNHPLLKDMIVHAPGTWHHSVRAALLAERAAAAVGANPLLARVMALYHDIGKIAAPRSFRENQSGGENPHDRLAPEESAAVLRGHVSEGRALAKAHGIPAAVAAVIEEHHADMVMESFLEKAKKRAADAGVDAAVDAAFVDERVFRYVGRLPQTKESALVLLADQIEATARNLGDNVPPARLADVVDHFVNRALTTDVLAACDLSLKDLGRARAALKATLLELSTSTPAPAPPQEPR
jgi:putative nucleotidyltransferase with HDIG domain